MVVEDRKSDRIYSRCFKMSMRVGLLAMLLCDVTVPVYAEWFMDRPVDKISLASTVSSNHADCIVADASGNIHFIWIGSEAYRPHVCYGVFDGTAWYGQETVGGSDVVDPDLAVGADGAVHVVWYEDLAAWGGGAEFYYGRSSGSGWGWPDLIGATTGGAPEPCIAISPDGTLHLIWHDEFDGHHVVFHWGLFTGLYTTPVWSADSVGPAALAASANGDLHLVWSVCVAGNWEIYYKMFDGEVWGPGERLTEAPGASSEPSVAVGADGTLHVVWVEAEGERHEVYHRVREASSWNAAEVVSDGAGSARSPRAAVDHDGSVHVVWTDGRSGDRQVYHRKKTAALWSPIERLTDIAGEAGNPGIAVDGAGSLHVLWHDNRDGVDRVYWKGSYPGTIPAPRLESVEPDSAFSGEVIDSLSLLGSGFVAPASAWMEKRGEAAVPLGGVRVLSHGEILCEVDLLRVRHGDWDIIVENPNGRRDTLKAGFRVPPLPRPLAVSIEPAREESNLGLHVAGLVGGEFIPPIRVWLDRAGYERSEALSTKVRSPDTLEFTLNLGGVASGLWNVVVENPDGGRDTLAAGFEVLPARWSEDIRLTDDAGGSMTGYSHSRTVAVDPQGRVHVVWYDDRSGHYEIYYKVLDGSVWSPDMVLTSDGAVSAHPAIATGPDGSVHVVWHDRRHGGQPAIYYKEHTLSGWGPDERISLADAEAIRPSIAVDGAGDVHVVWCEAHKGWQVRYRKRAAGEWQEEVALTETPGSHAFASIAVDDVGFVHVVWQGVFETSSSGSQIYYTWFDGVTWWPAVRLSYVGDNCLAPSVAADPGGGAHFVWHDACGEDICEIHYMAWVQGHWHPQEAITCGSGASRNPCVAVDDTGGVHVVWQDDRDGSQEMYYKYYDGKTWTSDVRLSATLSLSRKPSTAVDHDGRLHVVWHDDRDGNWEIYYKSRSPRPVGSSPRRVLIRSIVPNPTVGPCSVFAEMNGVGLVTVSVYDVTGRRVRKESTRAGVPGLVGIAWDGRDRDGKAVAPGVYFVKVTALRTASTGKVVVLR